MTGYGEGCPRSYVTGETVEGGAAFIRRHAPGIASEVSGAAGLRAWAEAHRREIDENPAAFCAVELALLDLFGKAVSAPVEDVLGVPRLDGPFTYSAVLGDSPYFVYRLQLWRYGRKGFSDFKVKVSGDLTRDRRRLRALRGGRGPQRRIRLDANNLWASADDCIRYLRGIGGGVFAVEEPLRAGDLAGFERVSEECGARIVLDESLLRVSQLEGLGSPERWIVNVRVSKMGGIGRSLEVVEAAAKLGVGVIVGAQVGETSILTRAGADGHAGGAGVARGRRGGVRDAPAARGPDGGVPDVRRRRCAHSAGQCRAGAGAGGAGGHAGAGVAMGAVPVSTGMTFDGAGSYLTSSE